MKYCRRVGWDVSHLEFTIEDHYYFSRLKKSVISGGSDVEEIRNLYELDKFDTLVFNYPEIVFTKEESEYIHSLVSSGKRAIVAGYYNNEDNISYTVNSLAGEFGVGLNRDGIRNHDSNYDGDPLLPVTDNLTLFNDSVVEVMFPCTASIEISADADNADPFILNIAGNGKKDEIIGAICRVGDGEFIILGSCVFWDNSAIVRYSNMRFSLNLLMSAFCP